MVFFLFTPSTPVQDPALGNLPMQFVQLVDFGPMALLRAAFKHVGGLDEGLSRPGVCGICKCEH